MSSERSVTLHSSWRGIVQSSAGALIVLALASAVVAAAGFNLVTGVFLAVGVVATVGVAFDYPLRSTFDVSGVTRRTMLRHHRIDWDNVRQLSRARPGFVASVRKFQLGGLVAVIGRRRYLLVDQGESGLEYDELERLLGDGELAALIDDVIRPADEVAPTWMYRRKRWHPPAD